MMVVIPMIIKIQTKQKRVLLKDRHYIHIDKEITPIPIKDNDNNDNDEYDNDYFHYYLYHYQKEADKIVSSIKSNWNRYYP